MHKWINKLRVWLIHKLGGYTTDEATHNRKIQRLKYTSVYTVDMQKESIGEIHFREREKAYKLFAENIVRNYAKLEEHRDCETREWHLRLSMRVVDEWMF